MDIEGTILTGREFTPITGRVVIADGRIEAIEEAPVESSSIILPAFINAHTHIGDSIAKDAGSTLSLEELVAPPDGLKHRLLREASASALIEGMEQTIRFMHQTGTGTFIDFREGGVPGVRALQKAAAPYPVTPIILGRDDSDVLDSADGYGASGAADGDFSSARHQATLADKLFGIHAGEHDPADINPALDLQPDFLVHLVVAEAVHLARIADRQTPVVVCPRSNMATGVGPPPIEELVARTTVALGTDNVMLSSPSMFREMAYVDSITDLSASTILGMATWAGADIIGSEGGEIAVDRPAKLLVLDGNSDNLAGSQDIVRSLVRRAGVSDINRVIL